jgi:hypothetical protein
MARLASLLLLALVTPSEQSADGFVGYFTGACPTGWSTFSSLEGRLALLFNDPYQAGQSVGWPLADGEDRAHSHILEGSFDFDSKHVASLGGLNTHAAKRGPQPALGWLNSSETAPSGYPFLQLTACRFNAISLQPPPILPLGGLALWDPATATGGCPDSFAPFDAGSGRILAVANASGGGVGTAGGPPMDAGADPVHAHTYTASLDMQTTDFAGIDGCCDDDPTSDSSKQSQAVSGNASTSLPHLSMLACTSNTTNTSQLPVVPPGFVLFSTLQAPCPPGWSPLPSGMGGRLVVATPQYGLPARTWGAPAVIPGFGQGWTGPSHTHPYEFSFTTTPAGIMLDTGCCAHGYGAQGDYTVLGDLDDEVGADEQLPLVVVGACVADARR